MTSVAVRRLLKVTEVSILPLVDACWLSARLQDPNIIVLDATFPLSEVENTNTTFQASHIPGARWLDFRCLSRKLHPVPRQIPSVAQVAQTMSALGIDREMHVVTYDQHGLNMGASRAWWLFHLFGHDRVSVLNGGLTAWLAANLPVESGPVTETLPLSQKETLLVPRKSMLLRTRRQVAAALNHDTAAVIDLRPRSNFLGTAPELLPNLPAGHIPGSSNLPFSDLLDGASARLLPVDRLRACLSAAGALDQPVIAMCGIGVVACTLSLALAVLGKTPAPVYDGSWADWASSAGTDSYLGA
jgi:thiosulfate/3-mercaptopyruvate sulfurtransferase